MNRLCYAFLALTFCTGVALAQEASADGPNILFCLADDQSYPHASAYGEPVIKTPVFDRIAREGVLFTHAYCAAPSCTPSRSAILTGQDIWRLGQGGQLFGTLPTEHPVYTDLLTESGYHVGYSDKGWAPGNIQAGGRTANPAGPSFKNFQEFFIKAPKGKPWCFWFGSRDPHRGYKKGSGIRAGMDPAKVRIPAIFPDTPEVRSDICDYFWEIQRFDQQVGEMLKLIEQAGQLDNTLVVITGDNGMPFPRAKATLYDLGVHMPMAIRWKKQVPGGRVIEDFVSQTDLAPTFLEAAGVEVPECMTGESLLDMLRSTKSGRVEPPRDSVVTARERHAWCRIDGKGYGSRMIRTHDFLYIRNYNPERLPTGDPRIRTNEGQYGDVDQSPTKQYMLANKSSAEGKCLFDLAFGKRPREEFFDCRKDPYQMHNLANDPKYERAKQELADRLREYLKKTGDPRETAEAVRWDTYEYYGRNNWPILPEPTSDTEPDPGEDARTKDLK